MHFTLAQIVTFERIVRLGTFHAAAEQLGLTQPTISQRVRELELSLGTVLFVRNGPKISLTADGHALVYYAEQVIGSADRIVERFKSRDPLKGILRLGLNESFAVICLPELLQRLESRYPDLKTSVHVGDTGVVSRLLNERKLDVGVVSEPRVESHVHCEPIGRNELAWIASSRLSIPAEPLDAAALSQFHLVISPPGARLHATVTDWFEKGGVLPARISTCNSISATIPMILAGIAVGLVPKRLMQEDIAAGRTRIVLVDPPVRGHEVQLCHLSSELGPGMEIILKMIREITAQRSAFTMPV